MNNPTFIIVDLFCGFGGTTTGFTAAQINGEGICKIIACVNHDPKAIKSHWLNHPAVTHFEEDIRTLDLTELSKIVKYNQAIYPDAYLILWASLECTNFSKAKGGQPRDADSRTLADHLERYITAINPDYVQIENVVEFMSWGPLDDNGKPLSRKNGSDFMRWRKEICSLGYYDEWKEMNSADYGAYTSRNRLFGCFAKNDLPIVWPQATHSKKATGGMFGNMDKWKPVKEVLNFKDEGESIFGRKKDLSDKTLERIYAGLIKYVANGDESFITKYFSGRPAGKVISTDSPAGTILTKDGQALVQAHFLLKYNSLNGKTGVHIPPSVEEPAPTVTCQGRLGVVTGEFLQHYYGNGFSTSMEDPCPTLRTKDGAALVSPQYFIDKQYGSGTKHQSIDVPAGSITQIPKLNLVEACKFIMPTNFNNQPISIEEPMQTITANRKHHYIVNPSHGGHSTSTDKPCPVIVARQDKAPLYLVQAEGGAVVVEVFESDSEIASRIKVFMAAYGLIDIKMRMLRIPELLRIQGFSDQYQMVGTQADMKKFIGNSVHPSVPKAWAEALGNRLQSLKVKVA